MYAKVAPARIRLILTPQMGIHVTLNPSKGETPIFIFEGVMEGVSKIEKVIFLENGLTDLDEIYICYRHYQDLLKEKVLIFSREKQT